MKISFRRKSLRWWICFVLILIVLGVVFCFGLFALEYKGILYTIRDKYPSLEFMVKLPKISDIFYLPYEFLSSPLPVYDIVVDLDDFKKLEQKLEDNTAYQLLPENRIKAPVEFIADKKTYNANIRVHGDLANHWKYQKKSWQIKIKDNVLFNGLERFNLILPEDRSYLLEYLSNYRAKKMGLLVPESRFVVLRLNGRNPAVYLETEAWRKEFLEANERPDRCNLYGENDDFVFIDREHDLFDQAAYWKKYRQESKKDSDEETFDNYADIDLLSQLVRRTASDEEFFKEIPNLLDMDNFYKWQAESMLMGSTHQDFIHNIRLFFDNSRGKFEFIPWDLRMFDRDKFADLQYNNLVSRILKIPEFLHQRNKVLWDYVKDDKNLENDLNFYNQTYQDVKVAFYQDEIKGFSNLFFDQKIKSGRQMLINQYRNIQKTLKESYVLATARIFPEWVRVDITTRTFSDIFLKTNEVDFYYDKNKNGLKDDEDIKLSDGFQMFSQREFPADFAFESEVKVLPTDYSFFINKKDFNFKEFKLDIINAVTGDKIEPAIRYVDEATFQYFKQITYSREEFLKDNPIFRAGASANQIVLFSGNYQINKTIVVPKGLSLEIKPGARLNFAPNVSLYSYSPVRAQGTVEAPIILTAQDKNKPWGVFAVIETHSEKNIFENCLVEYGGQDEVNGIFVTGQLAFHFSDAEVRNCQFKFASGDDGLNVKNANGIVENNYFYQNKFDGVDFDWARGRVADNYFLENGNDGIDFGGVHSVIVSNNRVERSDDKCLSIGEKSTNVLVINNLFNGGKIAGVAVKDDSEVELINNTIVNSTIGLNVFEKKPVFGGAHPKAVNNIIWANGKSIEVDSKSTLDISYSDIQGGYSGEGNLNQEPIFQNPGQGNYLLLDNQQNSALIKGGLLEAINAVLKEKLNVAPMGIISLPER